MQFEEFDKKVKEAAENHHPAYDEQAWAKMHKLLDKHLPEKDERRRRFAWLFFLLFLLGGAGIFYGVQSLISNRPEAIATARTVPVTKDVNTVVSTAPADGTQELVNSKSDKGINHTSGTTDKFANTSSGSASTGIVIPVAGEVKPLTVSGRNQVAGSKQKAVAVNSSGKTGTLKQPVNDRNYNNGTKVAFPAGHAKKKKKQLSQSVNDRLNENMLAADPLSPVGTPGTQKDAIVPESDPVVKIGNEVKADQPSLAATPAKAVVDPKADSTKDAEPIVAVTPSAKSKSPKKQSHLFLTLSAGPDASFAGSGKPGRIIPVTGAGIGYIYRERFSLRAGFYNAAKIYSASPDAYNAPPNFYSYYPFLVKVEANCRVYEIPVSFGYHFASRKNHSWFASASLSSYLMKRETYNYTYKTSAWGSVQQREWNLYNRNKHMFSVLGLSGGYQRKITERISFIAEPYLRVPLQGVGYGKVNLNSAGVLFSMAIQPAALLPGKQRK